MFYYRDFNHYNTRSEINPEPHNEIFTVTLENKKKIKREHNDYSIIQSAKPLAYFTAIFGIQIITYENNAALKVKLRSKMYTLLVIGVFILVHIFVKPKSWGDTTADAPLNILTKSFGSLSTIEVIYLIYICTIGNSDHYLQLMKKLDHFDQHLKKAKTVFFKTRMVAISLILISVVAIFFAIFLRFHIKNIGVFFTLYLFVLQGTVIVFFLLNIHLRLLILNDLLLSRLTKTLTASECKTSIFDDSFGNKLVKKLLSDSHILRQKIRSHYNWFELMQMYDKAADCVHLFNKIYAGQAYLMFQSSLFSTMLTICRYLSPSLKQHSYCILCDLYIYLCINIRPIYLTAMSDVISDQRNKTLSMLIKILVHSEMDDMYRNQLVTMIDLVSSRKMELACNVFPVNMQTTVNFSGRVISYTVLIIQYFYIHVFSQ